MTDNEFLAEFEATLERKLDNDDGEYNGFTPIERLAGLREWFQREVNNGGLETYFYNWAGAHAPETVRMLRTIGAAEAADILDQAIKLFGPAGPSADTLARREQLEGLSEEKLEQLETLTNKYFEAEDRGLVTYELLQKYLLTQR